MEKNTVCAWDGCVRAARHRGRCPTHYRELCGIERGLKCGVDGCTKPYHQSGYCSSHHQRNRKHGDPLLGGKPPKVTRAQDHEDGTRTCSECQVRLPLTDFCADKRATLGRRANCKSCVKARSRASYYVNPENRSARVRRYRRENVDDIRAKDSIRYERDKPRRIELATEAVHRRRALMQSTKLLPGITIRALRVKHGDLCCYCSVTMTFEPSRDRRFIPDKATLEHVVPLSRGGLHDWENTRLACWQCNVRKNNKLTTEWTAPTSR